MAKWTDEGENLVLDVFFKGATYPSNIYIGIYSNSTEPAENATLSDITEISGSGYLRQSIPANDWTLSGSMVSSTKKTFTATGDWGNCYGYFLATSNDNSGKLLAVEHFSDGPYHVENGDSIEITCNISCS